MEITDSVFVYRLAGGDRLSWHGRYHAHGSKEFEIHFFLEGEGSFRCNSTRYPISGGRLFLTGPREFHSIVPEAVSRPLSWYAFLFTFGEDASTENVRLRERLDSVLSSRHTVLTVNPNFRFQFEDLLQLSRSPDPALRDSARHLLSSFLWRWFGRIDPADVESSGSPLPSVNVLQSKRITEFSSDDAVSSSGSRLQGSPILKPVSSKDSAAAGESAGPGPALHGSHVEKVHVEKALAIMQKQVREQLKIEDLAWKLGLSTEHFIRIFRREVRMTPGQYFTRLKIEGASGMLISSDRSIGDISAWFGYANQFSFSRIFHRCTGMSPLEYRRTYLQVVDFS